MPYCWIEITNFGHFDVLVGLLCAAAVEVRVPSTRCGLRSIFGSGRLAQVHADRDLALSDPGSRAARYRLLSAAAVTIALGFGASLLLWGPSTFRPLIFAAGRSSHHLSIYRFLKGVLFTTGMAGNQ